MPRHFGQPRGGEADDDGAVGLFGKLLVRMKAEAPRIRCGGQPEAPRYVVKLPIPENAEGARREAGQIKAGIAPERLVQDFARLAPDGGEGAEERAALGGDAGRDTGRACALLGLRGSLADRRRRTAGGVGVKVLFEVRGEDMRMEDFLRTVSDRRGILEKAKKPYKARLAPDFTPFDFIRADRELVLSRLLAWLLDPEETHGQGTSFLAAFLEERKLLWGPPPWAECEVRLERPISAGRRLDILVSAENWALAIENKPWAADQPGQVADYLAYLDQQNLDGQKCLIYLVGTAGAQPSAQSISECERRRRERAGELVLLSYGELLPWLERCRTLSRADRVSTFLSDLIRLIQKQFLGVRDMTERDELIEFVADSADHVRSAMQIVFSIQAIKQRLLGTLVTQIRNELPDGWHIYGENIHNNDWPGVGISNTTGTPYCFRVEFISKNYDYNNFAYGIVHKTDHERAPDYVRHLLNANIGQGKNPTKGWPWYQMASLNDRILKVERDWEASEVLGHRSWIEPLPGR